MKTTSYNHFYGTGTGNAFPYIRYTLGDNSSRRLSNKKSIKNIWYQLDVFSNYPFDVQSNEMLETIESGLENLGLFTTDWIETIDDSNSTGFPVYRYFIEVRE